MRFQSLLYSGSNPFEANSGVCMGVLKMSGFLLFTRASFLYPSIQGHDFTNQVPACMVDILLAAHAL